MASQDLLDQVQPLMPSDFFSLACEIQHAQKIPQSGFSKNKFNLPDTSELLGEEKFADIALAWNADSILVQAQVKKSFSQSFFPNHEKGDSLEIFIDTRDVKTAGYATRFCHHFIFLPQEIQGIRGREITHFRTEDRHELCDQDELEVEALFGSSNYSLKISIPSSCLHGYEPSSFNRIGFTYRLNRFGGQAQHFSLSSKYYTIAQNPSLWSSLKLIN